MGLPHPLWMAVQDGDYFKPTAHQITDNYEGSCGQGLYIMSVSPGTGQCVCVSGECLLMCICPGCAVNPFKYLLIRPSTPFLLSRSVLSHSTPNYFNPLIAQRVTGLRVYRGRRDACVWKCGHISLHCGLITGFSAPRALQLWPAVGSTGVTPPKIRCQGIFYALVSIATCPPLLWLPCGLKQSLINLPTQSTSNVANKYNFFFN